MNPILKNVLAVLAGVVVGSIVNYGILILGCSIVPLPEGVIMGNLDSMINNMDKFEARHFITPFIAHAIGTLVGAYFCTRFAANNKFILAMIIGIWFLIGGISMCRMLDSPIWFMILDLAGAYIPMAWIGYKLANK